MGNKVKSYAVFTQAGIVCSPDTRPLIGFGNMNFKRRHFGKDYPFIQLEPELAT